MSPPSRAVLRVAARYLCLGLLTVAVVTDADGHRDIGFWILGVAFAILLFVAWQMLRLGREKTRGVIAKLETDPDVQFKIHRWGAIYWLANFPVVAWLFFFHRDFWEVVGIFITLIYSVYANLATDYGGMSSSMAAKGAAPLPEIPLQED